MADRSARLTLIEMFVIAVLLAAIGAVAVWQHGQNRSDAYVETMKDDLRNLATAQEA